MSDTEQPETIEETIEAPKIKKKHPIPIISKIVKATLGML